MDDRDDDLNIDALVDVEPPPPFEPANYIFRLDSIHIDNTASLKSGFGRSGNGFTVLIPRAENQIDYHTYNSFTLKHFPKPGSLPRAAKATKLCESVKPFFGFKMTDLSDARERKRPT